MSFDPLRCAEAAAQSALVLGAVIMPSAWHAWDSSLAMVLAGMLALLTSGVYALHAVTFDCFRITGHRPRQSLRSSRHCSVAAWSRMDLFPSKVTVCSLRTPRNRRVLSPGTARI